MSVADGIIVETAVIIVVAIAKKGMANGIKHVVGRIIVETVTIMAVAIAIMVVAIAKKGVAGDNDPGHGD